MTDLREVTLYENPEQGLSALPFQDGTPVAAVVGITVAEVEALKAALASSRVGPYVRERDEAREALDVVLIERNEAREHLDDAIELAASAIRAHTRAIHHLAGNCDYPEDEQAATGRWLGDALLDCREAREALGE